MPAPQVPGLQISVVSAQVEPAAALDAFPMWTNWQVLFDVTHGHAGGLQIGQRPSADFLHEQNGAQWW